MKTLLILSLIFVAASSLSANPAAERVLGLIGKNAGREMLETGAREAAERTTLTALSKIGTEGAEELVKRGGLKLLEAGARHGSVVLNVVRRVPEAARYLAACPEEALRLITRYGDDALRLEAKLPGMTEQAVAQFGRGELALLARQPLADVSALIGYAAKADSAATRQALLESFKKHGSAVLRELDKNKILILTGGLTISMIKVADSIGAAIKELPDKAPEAIRDLSHELGAGISASLGIISCGGLVLLAFWTWLHRPARKV